MNRIRNLSGLTRTLLGWAVFTVIVILLEVTAFNYLHWQTAGLQPQTIMQDGRYLDDNPREWSTPEMETGGTAGPGILFKQPTHVATVRVETARPVRVNIELSDEGSRDYVYSLQKDVYPSVPGTQTIPVNPYGGVLLMKVEVVQLLDDFTQPSDEETYLTQVQINAPIPFEFSFLRVATLLCLGLLIWGFGHGRRIFRLSVFQGSALSPTRAARVTLWGTSAAVTAILAAGIFVFPPALGTFEDDGYHYYSDYEAQYAELAESFLEGRVDLDIEPFPGLRYADNPYDMTQRITLEETYGTSIYSYWDMAYYRGHYFVYFGVLPVLLFYLPWFLITGQMFPTFIGVGIALAFAVFGIGSLLLQLARRWFPRTSLGVMMLCTALVPLASMLAWCTMNATIYSLPVLCGLACLAWGASLYARLDRRPWLVVPGSVLLALTFACRPQIGAFCVLLIPFGIQAMRKMANGAQRAKAALEELTDGMPEPAKTAARQAKAAYLTAALIPFVVVFVLLGLYNAARFGSPLDFGANYNLTTNDMRLRPWTPEAALAGLYYLVLQPPSLEPAFPFFCDTQMPFEYSTYLVYETCLGGVLWVAPVLWFLCALLAKGRPGNPLPGRVGAWRAMVGVTVGLSLVIVMFDALAAGILPRYDTDFMMPLSVLAALGLMRTAGVANGAPETEANALAPVAIRPWVARCAVACLIVALAVSVAIIFYSWGRYQSDRSLYMMELNAQITQQLL